MIFGGLDTGTGSVPILNDNSAIMGNIAQADTVIRTAPSDSHTAILSQIQEDVESLEAGMEHQIIDPYTETAPVRQLTDYFSVLRGEQQLQSG